MLSVSCMFSLDAVRKPRAINRDKRRPCNDVGLVGVRVEMSQASFVPHISWFRCDEEAKPRG